MFMCGNTSISVCTCVFSLTAYVEHPTHQNNIYNDIYDSSLFWEMTFLIRFDIYFANFDITNRYLGRLNQYFVKVDQY